MVFIMYDLFICMCVYLNHINQINVRVDAPAENEIWNLAQIFLQVWERSFDFPSLKNQRDFVSQAAKVAEWQIRFYTMVDVLNTQKNSLDH
jgi:hypothetical protein